MEKMYFIRYLFQLLKNIWKENEIDDEDDLPEYFVTAQNLNPYDRIKMQGIWQKRIDASISSTINLVNKVSVEEVEKLYLEAWKMV